MKKQIISKDEEKLNIVILRNDSMGICVKGISKCHPEDEYDREKGIHIANTKAWIKYYEKLGTSAERSLAWEEDMLKYYTDEVARLKSVKEMSAKKVEKISAEYNQLIKEI